MPMGSLPATFLFALATVVAVAVQAHAETRPGPCVPGTGDMIVCGGGAGAPIVLDDTTSPSGKLAIAWRDKGESTEFPEPDNVENSLVRLADGKSLAVVVGRKWVNGKGRANHVYQTVAWSPDGRWLLVGDGGKWALEAMAVYAVDERAGMVKSLGLFRAVTAAATAGLKERMGAPKAASYQLDIADAGKIVVASSGAVTIPMRFQVPKQDQDIDLLVRFNVSREGRGVASSRVGVTFVKR